MQSSNTPTKVPLPFAASGTKNVIPLASQIGTTPGAASLTDGFPPLTFTPIAAGGIPPSGADFNGILNLITQSVQWANAGGGFVYDSTFSAAINGYPKGCMLLRADLTGYWFNTIDANTSNPDTGGVGWIAFSVFSPTEDYGLDTGSGNAYQVTYTPAVTVLADGLVLRFKASTANTGPSTFSPNGLAAQPIVGYAHTALQGSEIAVNSDCWVQWNSSISGGAWVLLNSSAGALQLPGGSYGVTPSSGDNTTKLATTAFVRANNPLDTHIATIDQALVGTSNTTLMTPYLVSLAQGARTLYISTTGSDSNDGLTPGTPLLTINAAVARVPEGGHGTFHLADGTYNLAGEIDILGRLISIIGTSRAGTILTTSIAITESEGIFYNSFNSQLIIYGGTLRLETLTISLPARINPSLSWSNRKSLINAGNILAGNARVALYNLDLNLTDGNALARSHVGVLIILGAEKVTVSSPSSTGFLVSFTENGTVTLSLNASVVLNAGVKCIDALISRADGVRNVITNYTGTELV